MSRSRELERRAEVGMPRHSAPKQRGPVIVRPFIEVRNNGTLVLNNTSFTVQSPSTYGAFYDLADKRVDFERRAGETRVEIVPARMTIGSTQQWLWDFIPTAGDDGEWDAFGQVHGLNDGLGRSAPVALFREKVSPGVYDWKFRTRATDVTGTVVSENPSSPYAVTVTLGQRYSVDLTFKQHATDGICIVKFGPSGQALPTVVNETGMRIGFPDEEDGQPASNGPYFKFGIYGDTANTTPARASYYDIRSV